MVTIPTEQVEAVIRQALEALIVALETVGELEAENARLLALLRDIAAEEPGLDDARLRCVKVRIDRETWDQVRALSRETDIPAGMPDMNRVMTGQKPAGQLAGQEPELAAANSEPAQALADSLAEPAEAWRPDNAPVAIDLVPAVDVRVGDWIYDHGERGQVTHVGTAGDYPFLLRMGSGITAWRILVQPDGLIPVERPAGRAEPSDAEKAEARLDAIKRAVAPAWDTQTLLEDWLADFVVDHDRLRRQIAHLDTRNAELVRESRDAAQRRILADREWEARLAAAQRRLDAMVGERDETAGEVRRLQRGIVSELGFVKASMAGLVPPELGRQLDPQKYGEASA